MQISYPSFDQLVTNHFPDVYRLCLLLTKDPSSAWQTAFQTFLYMGTIAEPFPDEAAEQNALFSWCVRTCTDYYYRKIRRKKRREFFEQEVPFPVSDSLWELLGLPLQKKAAVFFNDYLGFAPERTRLILKGDDLTQNASHKTSVTPQGPKGAKEPGNEQWQQAVASIRPAEDAASQLLGEIYLRFEERNVSLENKLRNIRYWWDHAVIWIAAAIILLFAAAAWYTAQIVV